MPLDRARALRVGARAARSALGERSIGGSGRQDEAEYGFVVRTGDQPLGPQMFAHSIRDGETEAVVAGVGGLGAAPEALKDVKEFVGRDGRPLIGDANRDTGPGPGGADGHGGSRTGVGIRVLEQGAEHGQ